MANPTEEALGSTAANALSGTTSANTQFVYCTIGDSTYYTEDLEKEAILDRAVALSNALRVVKDGDLTYGVFAGKFSHGGATVTYAGSAENALTDDDTNYIYLTSTGTLTKNTTGFPAAAHVPLATILTASSAFAHTDITDYRGASAIRTEGQAELRGHRIDLLSVKNEEGTELDGGASNFEMTSAGWGTGTFTLDGNPATGASVTDTLMFEHVLGPGYVSSADVKLVVWAKESVAAAEVSTTISAEVYECDGDGTVSADLAGAWDEDDVTDTGADKTLAITDAGLVAGDKLRIFVRIVTNDTGGAHGTVAQIGDIDVQYDDAVGV